VRGGLNIGNDQVFHIDSLAPGASQQVQVMVDAVSSGPDYLELTLRSGDRYVYTRWVPIFISTPTAYETYESFLTWTLIITLGVLAFIFLLSTIIVLSRRR
jgi:hypothetical protein